MIISPSFAGKRYAVLGLARSGLSTVETLLASGARVTAWDNRDELPYAWRILRDGVYWDEIQMGAIADEWRARHYAASEAVELEIG